MAKTIKEERLRWVLPIINKEEQMAGIGKRAENWLELAENVFIFARDAKKKFEETKDLQVKRQILQALGTNFVLKDKKLTLDLENVLFPVQTVAKMIKTGEGRFEPVKNRMNKRQTGDFSPACRALLRKYVVIGIR